MRRSMLHRPLVDHADRRQLSSRVACSGTAHLIGRCHGENFSFVAIDFETANRSMASVCQVGVTLVVNGLLQRTGSWYVIPPTGIESFNPFNIRIHGTTSETVTQNQRLTW